MYCKNCGEVLNDGQEVCLKCGYKKAAGSSYCANCGAKINDPGQEICLQCGHKLKESNLSSGDSLKDLTEGSWVPEGKDKVTATVLAFFLGSIGIHNFYLGETKKGIVKIVASLCCGIGFILALIDFIKMLLNKYTVDYNALF